tara:strand:+ start:4727 stop:4885 length:159 start_codon:yes stop_codon:yes gene_type:complete
MIGLMKKKALFAVALTFLLGSCGVSVGVDEFGNFVVSGKLPEKVTQPINNEK